MIGIPPVYRIGGPAFQAMEVTMASELVVWYVPLGELGEDAIDLSTCRRFIVSWYGGQPGADGLTYYYSKGEDGKGEKRIRCRTFDDYDQDYNDTSVVTGYLECRPEEVAHEILRNRVYGDRLPKELDGYREFGDIRTYSEWCAKHGGVGIVRSGPPKPVWENRRLSFKGKTCKKFAREADQQFLVIESFQRFGWPPSVANPFSTHDQLLNTIKNMNQWEGSPIYFKSEDGKVVWKPRASEG